MGEDTEDPEIAVLHPQGRLDLAGAPTLETLLSKAAATHRLCVVDLSQIAFLASVGIRALLHAARDLNARGGRLVLSGPTREVAKVLAVSGVAALLPIAPDLAEAIRLAKPDA